MGKTNWKRVFLGGLLAGVVMFVLGFATYEIYLEKLRTPAMEALAIPMQMSVGLYIFAVVMSLIVGILAIWLYSAIRPRYGTESKIATIAGIAFWILSVLLMYISYDAMGLFPIEVLVIDSLRALVILVVATLVGGYVYKEQQ